MINNLVIVESPAKAKTIEKILGKDFQVKSSMGHIRDLSKNDLSIDTQKNFAPRYTVPADKKKVVTELKSLVKKSKVVWLASDEDREGEAIAWHLAEELGLKPEKTRRIVFHEITKDAIEDAIENPRAINQDLVNAQQARRVLDRLVGYELSPVLWKKIKPSLSAGRVQSVAVRLIVDREREIIGFKSTSAFKLSAVFDVKDSKGKKYQMEAELNEKFAEKKKALEFLNLCRTAVFTVENVVKKPSRKSPSPPFTTSTLQQEASRKLGFSVSQTMTVAQHLYEAGKITYMRTDSVNLSNMALDAASEVIARIYGEKYVNRKNYKTKSKGAQEAHEAIRPTGLDHETIAGTGAEKRLYELIWKRTIASQMSDAQLEKTTVTIGISNAQEKFIAEGEVMKFDGFLKVYFESSDDEPEEDTAGLLPPIEKGMNLTYDRIAATERFTHYPPRYTEASLVKKLEELGIGRPSTFAPTISTIQQRGYVLKEDRPGRERKYFLLVLKNNTVHEETKTENTGAEKNKLFPDNIGMIVNDFLVEYFGNILDFNFTASVEKEFDEIAAGKIVWHKMIAKFYKPFHEKVTNTLAKSAVNKGERKLGSDPETGKPVSVRMGRFGPVVQIGEVSAPEKPRYASLRKGQNLESITMDEAMELFKLPRTIGKFEDKDMVVSIGRFGPYILHNSSFYSLNKGIDDPYTVDAARAIEIISEKRLKDQNKVLRTFAEDAELSILNGRWGPYIKYKKENYKIPKTSDPGAITYKECLDLISNPPARKKKEKITYACRMELNHYFEPVALDKPGESVSLNEDVFGRNIRVNTASHPIDEISNYQIALIGVPEDRNSFNRGASNAPDRIREKLYPLYKVSDKIRIIDLGNLKATPTAGDTYFGLRDVMLELLNNQVTAVVLGGSQDLTLGAFLAFEQARPPVNLVTIDSRINTGAEAVSSDSWLQSVWKSTKLLRYAHVGHQQYLVSPRSQAQMDQMGFEAIRLGVLRNNLAQAEPGLRDAHLVSFDISAVRQSDAPANPFASPNGLYAEDSCQLARYAGLSDHVSCFGIFEINPAFDHQGQTAHLAAQMVWYFMEGFMQRRTETPSSGNPDFKVFIVNHEDMEHELTFYKSQVTNRWWMEVPEIKSGKAYTIACTQDEYQQASNHDIPDLWWRTFQRIN